MITRREGLKIAAGGAAVLAGAGGAAPLAAASRMTHLVSLGMADFHNSDIKVLASAARIAVPTYRFGVVVRSGISASGGSGNVSMEASAELVGVTLPLMRKIAGDAISDLLMRLMEAGREIVNDGEMWAAAGYAKLKPSPVPFVKKPFADARTVAMVSPEGIPLFSQHSDAPLSDQSPLSLGNWRAINAICAQLKCVVMIPTVVIDFAALSGSGHSVFGGSARVGIQSGLYLVPQFTQLSAHFAKIALAGPGGKLILKDRAVIGQAGELVQTGSRNNREEVAWWNAVDRFNPNAISPGRAYESSTYEYRVDPAQFAKACLEGAKSVNAIYAAAAGIHKPG